MPTLGQLLGESDFADYVEVDPHGLQLPSFIATVIGLKPAMDLWVTAQGWPAFAGLAERFGLVYYVDHYLDRHAPELADRAVEPFITTTRAALSLNFTADNEAHVFVARSATALRAAVASGWYPLLVGRQLIEKPYPDHERFGLALGYPDCCRAFFRQHNNWQNDNTYYRAYRHTTDAPSALSNSLLRHTAYYLVPHLACSFACRPSIAYSQALLAFIAAESPLYAAEVLRQLRLPVLCLSERHIYLFDGYLDHNQVYYRGVAAVNPTKADDPFYRLLAMGNRCALDRNVVRVFQDEAQVAAFQCRGDQVGPQVPFLLHCR